MAMKLNLGVFNDIKWDEFTTAINIEKPGIHVEHWLFIHYNAIEVTPSRESGYEGYREFLFPDDGGYMEFCLKWL